MFNGTPIFVRLNRYGRRFSSVAGMWGGWLLMAPGLALIFMGLAILIWPELLAYMVAAALIFAGTTIALWGWQLGRTQRRIHESMRERFYGQAPFYQEPFVEDEPIFWEETRRR
ncbi:MAG: hypothetical protein D6790_11395 [Caldilineae bacterium]|nr:MAG: hypothetical protein D6790_11395 [Caldilineae bacterium]